MSTAAVTEPAFAPVAKQVQAWVTVRRWLSLLRLTLIPATLVLILLVLATLRGKTMITSWFGLLLWLGGVLAYAWWRRPGPFSALALWDQAAGRREAFASAWWFEQRGEGGDAARAHIDLQRQALPEVLPALRKDLPLRPDRWLLVPVAVAVLGSLVHAVITPRVEVLTVDGEMSRRATDEAKKLAQSPLDKKKLAGLEADEQKQIEDLKEKVQQTAADLANAAGKDARSVLAELERRAREAESLADELGSGREAWASDKLVEALRQHTDTADLGDAVAAKNAQTASQAAEGLASQLESPQLSPEVRDRLKDTLTDVQNQADAEDRKRAVGQNVLAAGDEMQKGNAAGAGQEFQKLADKLRDQALREQARQELQQLAQQLRDSGSNIASQGENQSGSMQQLGQNSPSGAQGQQGAPQVGQSQSGQQPLSPPGLGQQGQQNQMQPQSQNGQGQQGQQMMTMGQGQQGQPGQQGPPANGQPMLLAPVPGAPPKQDDKSPVLIAPGSPPSDGPNASRLLMTGNGLTPGAGKADLNSAPTEKQQTGNQNVVQAQQTAEGQSTVRSVEGGTHQEGAARSATQTALDAIQAEEAALDEAALPPARREQVRRYFNELRRRFEAK